MKIADGLYAIPHPKKKGGHVFAYLCLFGKDGPATLIDAGPDSDGQYILDYMRWMNLPPRLITRILVTHAHASHIGGLEALRQRTGAEVYAHAWEAQIIEGKRNAVGSPRISPWPWKWKPRETGRLQVGLALGLYRVTPSIVHHHLRDYGYVGAIQAFHTPGHTTGHFAFYWHGTNVLFCGDAVATWPTVSAGWPGLTLDQDENLRSVAKLAKLERIEFLCCGHGDPLVGDGTATLKMLAATT